MEEIHTWKKMKAISGVVFGQSQNRNCDDSYGD